MLYLYQQNHGSMRSLLLLIAFSILSCNSNGQHNTAANSKPKAQKTEKSYANKLANAYYNPSKADLDLLSEIFNKLSPEQKAAQLIMIASSEKLGFPYETSVKPLADKGIAANYIFLKGTSTAFRSQEQYLNTKTHGGLLPVNACDCEATLMHNKFTDQPRMSPTSRLSDSTRLIASLDSIMLVMKSLNIAINFAPVADLGTNKAVISNRAFSTNKDSLIRYNNMFINYSQDNGIAATVKHFPGHGAVVGDTHKEKVWIDGAMQELETFRSIIAASDPLLVMVGHISVKNNPEGYNTPNGIPASISRNIVTDLLKKQLGFKGIVTTDAMNMGAIKNIPNADFEAVKAGVDLVLMPNDPQKLHHQIVAALQANDALSRQIEVSVKKIILLKIVTGRITAS